MLALRPERPAREAEVVLVLLDDLDRRQAPSVLEIADRAVRAVQRMRQLANRQLCSQTQPPQLGSEARLGRVVVVVRVLDRR